MDKINLLEELEDEEYIDELIIPLVEEINDIDELVTMNSCQGGGGSHCKMTYVDFYVLNHHYSVAHALMGFIMAKYGEDGEILGSMQYEESGFVNEENYFIPNGKASLRFRIEGYSPESIKLMRETIEEFKELLDLGDD